MSTPEQRRILDRITVEDRGHATPCWVSTLTPKRHGYAELWLPGGTYAMQHRFAYEAWVGPIPPGLVIDHLCRVKMCCKPSHLEPVTDRVNVIERGRGLTASNARKTHCPAGHAFDETNTYTHRGQRHCRACRAAREAARAPRVRVCR